MNYFHHIEFATERKSDLSPFPYLNFSINPPPCPTHREPKEGWIFKWRNEPQLGQIIHGAIRGLAISLGIEILDEQVWVDFLCR